MEAHLPRRYRLLRPLGRGGQGRVWLAADRLHGNARVALKILPGSPGAGLDSEKLSSEFLTLARLTHPNIARVRDFGWLARQAGAYFTCDYVRGSNLLDWAAGLAGESKWPQIIDVAAQALSVIQYLALRGLCHGDVKPANLLVAPATRDASVRDARPTLKLIDFGTARLRANLGTGGNLMGTPAYLPPPEAFPEGDGARADIYSLGISLHHAATGRLPFAIGEPGALERWWKAGAPVHARAMEPAIPAVLDSLIDRLTRVRGGDAFRSAGEALELLRSRVALSPMLRPGGADEAWFSGRESFVESILAAATDPSNSARAHVITAPRGSGKTRVLELVEASFQARGFRTVLFRSAGDLRALRALKELARGADAYDGLRSPGRSIDIPQLLDSLSGQATAVLVDPDVLEGRTPSGGENAAQASNLSPVVEFLRSLAHEMTRVRRGARRTRMVLAAVTPESAARCLQIESRWLAVHPLEPLSSRSVADAIREYFAVEEAPEEVVALVLRASRGLPRLVSEALERLAAHGASSDFLGQLSVPRPLPTRLVISSRESTSRAGSLDAASRRVLGLLRIANEPLTAEGAAALFPELEEEEWNDRLESLRRRGFLNREEGEVHPVYHVALTDDSAPPATALLGAEEVACRRALGARHVEMLRSPSPPPAETFLAAADNFLVLSEPALSARFVRRAMRRPRSADLDGSIASFYQRLLNVPSAAWKGRPGTDGCRARLCAQLRASEILTRMGRYREALAAVASPDQDAPGWHRRRALSLRAGAHDGAGETLAAIQALESLREDCSTSILRLQPARSGRLELARSEATAKLSTLYFRAGRPVQGRACLEEGRKLLGELERIPAPDRGSLLCGVLARFASAESAHGEADRALRFLEEAVRLARESGRDDLSLGPLQELGIACGQTQRWPEALQAFEEIEAITKSQGDRTGALKAVYNRAIIHYRLHDLDRAEALFREARELSDSLGRHAFSSTVWLGFASVLRERGRILEALRLYRRVLGQAPGARLNDLAVAHNNASEIYLLLGRLRKATLHANLAFRIARRTENRFLLGLALRSRGLARFAAGRSIDARRDLESAIDLGAKDGDDRARGTASYYLGLVAAASEDPGEALRRLRDARTWSRRARDLPHLHAATIALLGELVRAGRSTAARRILLGRSRRTLARGSLAARVLIERLRDDWPGNHEEVLNACREEARRGNVWDVFCTLHGFLRDPRLTEEIRQALVLEKDTSLRRLLKGLPRRHEARFRELWCRPFEGALLLSEAPSQSQVAPAAPALLDGAVTGEELLKGLIEELRVSLGARSACLLLDPNVDRKAYVEVGSAGAGLESMLEARARIIATRQKPDRVFDSPPFLLLRLPNPKAVRFLCMELPSVLRGPREHAKAQLLEKALTVSLALRIFAGELDLAVERTRLAEAQAEVRRLNAFLVKDRQGLETALLTQRIALLDLRRELGARASGPRRSPVGASRQMRSILERLPRIAAHDIPVLLLGESGVGKDLLARRIHDLSARREHPYAAEICNIAESLMEAELFGFAEGAFTGAVASRPGIFERSSGGTIYLDEISGLPQSLQSRLLRVFEEKEVRPIGAERTVRVDFRLIASSCLSLSELRGSSRFRQDLLYRIQGEVIEIPPLRERREDIPPLVADLVAEHARTSGNPVPYVCSQAMERLLEHEWRGNVRELENEISRVCVGNPVEITADMLFTVCPPGVVGGGSRRAETSRVSSLKDEKRRLERQLLLNALKAHSGNATRAARELRITRRYLGILLGKHAIRLRDMKAPRIDPGSDPGKLPSAQESARAKKAVNKGDLRNRRPNAR